MSDDPGLPSHPETLRRLYARLEPRHMEVLQALADAGCSVTSAELAEALDTPKALRHASQRALALAAHHLVIHTPTQRNKADQVPARWTLSTRGAAVLRIHHDL